MTIATICYTINRNCVHIACAEDIDFTNLVDAIIDTFEDQCNKAGSYQGSYDYLEWECLRFAKHFFPDLDWYFDLDESRTR